MTANSITTNRGSPSSQAPIQEENEDVLQLQPQQQLQQSHANNHHQLQNQNQNPTTNSCNTINYLSLFSSPSMPNISLGRPHLTNSTHFTSTATMTIGSNPNNLSLNYMAIRQPDMAGLTTADYKPGTACVIRQHHHQPLNCTSTAMSNLEIGAETTVIHSRSSDVSAEAIGDERGGSMLITPTGIHGSNTATYMRQPPPFTHHENNAMYLTQNLHNNNVTPSGQNLNKQGNRPLGRTQSAPLPLGHPILTAPMNITQTHFENSEVGILGF